MRVLSLAALICAASGALSAATLVPEILYYSFDEGSGTTTANLASTATAPATANLIGQTFNATGIDGSSLGGNGGNSTSNYLSTGWNTSLSGSWSISMWLSPLINSSTLFYYFGDVGAGSFRAFTNGVAGPNNVILRGAFTDTLITGLSTTQNNHVAFVYSDVDNTIRGYLNGVLNVTQAQGAVTISGGGDFKVGGYSGNTGLHSGGWLDEFRLYSRALSGTEVNTVMTDFGSSQSSVPEPSSLALCGAAALVAAVAARRRK